MRVILNDRVLFLPLTGVGHYTSQLRRALLQRPRELHLHCFITDRFARRRPASPEGEEESAPPTARRSRGLLRLRWARRWLTAPYRWAFSMAARGYDLYHEPNHIPIATGITTVTTIHDLSVIAHPEWHPEDRVRWYEREFDRGLRRTTRFIAASEFTRRDMVRRLSVPADRIDVVYQAPRLGFKRMDLRQAQRLCAALELPERFLLFVGTIEPRKNIVGLLEAYAALPAGLRRKAPLIIAGGWGWKMSDLPDTLRRHGLLENTRMIGYQGDGELAALYNLCEALVWPTLFEGFGLPPLEAMSCGAPVITSSTTSIPEVVGDAGVLLDPGDVPSWTESMRRVLEDEPWRRSWIERGIARATEFTWQRCAEQTLQSYRTALADAYWPSHRR